EPNRMPSLLIDLSLVLCKPNSFDSGHRDALDEATSGDQESNDERRREYGGGGGQGAVIRAGLCIGEKHHPQRRRREMGVRNHDQWPVKIVPMRDDRKYRKRRDRRPCAGYDDQPHDLEFAHAVEPGGMNDFIRVALEELAKQEDREDRQEERHHDREI